MAEGGCDECWGFFFFLSFFFFFDLWIKLCGDSRCGYPARSALPPVEKQQADKRTHRWSDWLGPAPDASPGQQLGAAGARLSADFFQF